MMNPSTNSTVDNYCHSINIETGQFCLQSSDNKNRSFIEVCQKIPAKKLLEK